MCVRKFCMRYILNKQFLLNISRVISKSVRRELTFLVECISICVIMQFILQTYIAARSDKLSCHIVTYDEQYMYKILMHRQISQSVKKMLYVLTLHHYTVEPRYKEVGYNKTLL